MALLREIIKSIKAALLLGRRFERTIDEVVLLGHRVDRAEQAIQQRLLATLATIEAMATEIRRMGPRQGQILETVQRGATSEAVASVEARVENQLLEAQKKLKVIRDAVLPIGEEMREVISVGRESTGLIRNAEAALERLREAAQGGAARVESVAGDTAWLRQQMEAKFGGIDLHTIREYEGLLRFLRKTLYMQEWECRRQELPRLVTDHPGAVDTDDTRFPRGAKNDNSINPRFNQRLYEFTRYKKPLNVLDLGCAGGGFVRSLIDDGHFAIGLEGSDYCRLTQRAEWSTIPFHLHTCDVTKPFTLEDAAAGGPFLFDVVTAWEFMEHMPGGALAQVFDNIHRHLIPGGHFLCSIATFEDYDRQRGAVYHLSVHPREWWLERFGASGFDAVEHHPFGPDDWLRGSGHARGDWTESQGLGFHLVLRKRGG